jgi:DNA-binding NtrC family response regulator
MWKKVILFAENNASFRNQRAEFLEAEGFRVIPAANAGEARVQLAKQFVNLAILDIRLRDDNDGTDLSGLALARAPAYFGTPKIILTDHEATGQVALEQGANGVPFAIDVLSKADGPDAMVVAVKRAIALSQIARYRYSALGILLSVVGLGILAMLTGDLKWLAASTALGVLYAGFMWWIAT